MLVHSATRLHFTRFSPHQRRKHRLPRDLSSLAAAGKSSVILLHRPPPFSRRFNRDERGGVSRTKGTLSDRLREPASPRRPRPRTAPPAGRFRRSSSRPTLQDRTV